MLVSKRSGGKNLSHGSEEASLAQFRFCCDFRYLNTQTQDFHYTIPDLQDLTESFSHRSPMFISFIDLRAFFQMSIAPESRKYTAFNTCFWNLLF